MMAGIIFAAPDFHRGRQIARAIPNKAGGTIWPRFTYAWAAWKIGVAAFVLMFVSILAVPGIKATSEPPPAFMTALLLLFSGFAPVGRIDGFGPAGSLTLGNALDRRRGESNENPVAGNAHRRVSRSRAWTGLDLDGSSFPEQATATAAALQACRSSSLVCSPAPHHIARP